MRALVIVMSVAACGGGDKLTSISESKKMGELSKDEMKQLCEDFKVYQTKSKLSDAEALKMACNVTAVMSTLTSDAADDAALRTGCKKELDACIAKQEKPPDPVIDCSSEQFLGTMGECKDVTIGEMTGCVKDLTGVTKRFAAEDLCGGLKAGDKDATSMIFDKDEEPEMRGARGQVPGHDQAGWRGQRR